MSGQYAENITLVTMFAVSCAILLILAFLIVKEVI